VAIGYTREDESAARPTSDIMGQMAPGDLATSYLTRFPVPLIPNTQDPNLTARLSGYVEEARDEAMGDTARTWGMAQHQVDVTQQPHQRHQRRTCELRHNVHMASPAATPPVYRLRITLVGIDPPIWRVVQLPSSMRLSVLHDAFQIVMGWTDSHLHQFEKDGKFWAVPDPDEDADDLDLIDEREIPVGDVLTTEGESLIYVYDFGDEWRHQVVLEKIVPSNDAVKGPICLGGARRCPPEDVGGISGYRKFLEATLDPNHEDNEHLAGRGGGHIQDGFDAKAVNESLSRMKW
jgi:hypothetical protein